MKERLAGLAMVLVGALLGYLCVYQPLQSARAGEPTVSVSLKGAILAPIGLMGLVYLALGSRVTPIMGPRDKPTPAAYVGAVVVLLLGVGLYLWLRSTLQAHGYDFHGRF